MARTSANRSERGFCFCLWYGLTNCSLVRLLPRNRDRRHHVPTAYVRKIRTVYIDERKFPLAARVGLGIPSDAFYDGGLTYNEQLPWPIVPSRAWPIISHDKHFSLASQTVGQPGTLRHSWCGPSSNNGESVWCCIVMSINR